MSVHLLDKMKDAVIAKVAAQAADFYKSAYSSSQVQSVKQVFEKVTTDTDLLVSTVTVFIICLAVWLGHRCGWYCGE